LKLRVHPGCFRHAFSRCPLGPRDTCSLVAVCVHLRAGGGGDLWRRQHSGGHCGGGGHTCHTQRSPGSTRGGRHLPRRWVRRPCRRPKMFHCMFADSKCGAEVAAVCGCSVEPSKQCCCRRGFDAYPSPTPYAPYPHAYTGAPSATLGDLLQTNVLVGAMVSKGSQQ
jgi:hypothetical protein